MPWLMRDASVLASVEVAESWRERTLGLLGRDGIEGALLLRPARSVHTFGMRFPIDVAFCDAQLVVVKTITLARHRITAPVWSARCVLEAEAGAFAEWRLRPGDRLYLKGDGVAQPAADELA
jgi:uncharacterized membrane protein (UPF0127 family)